MLFYTLSRLGSICRGLACYCSYSISCHALAVSAEAWHAILYFITPWQYLYRLGMLFYILSHLGSICRSLAYYSIFNHALAVSAEARHTILYLITPWQHLPNDKVRQTSKNPSYKSANWNLKNILELQKPKLQKPELRKLQVEQTETCRRAGVRGTLWIRWQGCGFRKCQRILDWPARQIWNNSCQNFRKNNIRVGRGAGALGARGAKKERPWLGRGELQKFRGR